MLANKQGICLNLNDNVAVIFENVELGDLIEIKGPNNEKIAQIQAKSKIEMGHKVALKEINIHSEIIKHGETIGQAKEVIEKGTLVHIHNIESLRGRGDKVD